MGTTCQRIAGIGRTDVAVIAEIRDLHEDTTGHGAAGAHGAIDPIFT
jgi:hypothetical protein